MFLNSENIYVIISAGIISFSGFLVFLRFPKEAFLLFITGLFSVLYHLNPENQILRAFDWISALVLVFILLPKVYLSSNTLIAVTAFFLFILWFSSVVFFYFGKIEMYNITHTFWHVGIAVFCAYLLGL